MRKSTEATGTRCRPHRHAPRHPGRRRPGNVLILFAVLLTSLIGMVAFAIDTGYIALYKTRMQRAADAAALAGAQAAMVPPGETQNEAAVRAEVKKYIDLNMRGLTVRDEDIRLARYTAYYPEGSRLSYTYSTADPANCVQVTLRRDGLQNSPLKLFFAPVIGTKTTSLAVTSVAYMSKASGVRAQAPLLPYTMQYDYYYAAMGQTRTGVDGETIQVTDDYTVTKTGTGYSVTGGPDGVNEVYLFGDKPNGPGNFGSIDLGSGSNGTGELERQILYGPTEADFSNPDFVFKLASDGSLVCPFIAEGDSGLSTSIKDSFQAILGQPRIIPLYGSAPGLDGIRGTLDDTDLDINLETDLTNIIDEEVDGRLGTGNTARYNIIGYAGVVVSRVDFTGNPKGIWVQPAFVASNRVTPMTSDNDSVTEGVYCPPKLVIP